MNWKLVGYARGVSFVGVLITAVMLLSKGGISVSGQQTPLLISLILFGIITALLTKAEE